MKQWFSSHFQRLFLIFKLLFYSLYTYSSDSSVSYCINFYLLLYVMRFCRCRWGFISEVLQNVAGSWWLWIIPDDVGVIQNKHTSFDTRGRNLCVCAEPRWRKELKCQSLKTKPREVRALNLLRTFVERESEQWWRGNHLHSKHFLSSGVIKEDGDEWNPLLLLLLISTFSDLPLARRPASLILNVSPIRTNSWWMRARVCNTQSEAIVFN